LIYQKTIALMQDLAGDNADDRKAAIENIKRLAEEGTIPHALVPSIEELVEKNEPAQFKEIAAALRKSEQNHTVPDDDNPATLSPIIFLQITDEKTRDIAKKLEALLEEKDYTVPGIERVSRGPKARELRYFRKSDEQEAASIVSMLNNSGWATVNLKYVRGYENAKVIRPRQYEFWFEDSHAPITDVPDIKDATQKQSGQTQPSPDETKEREKRYAQEREQREQQQKERQQREQQGKEQEKPYEQPKPAPKTPQPQRKPRRPPARD
jgi:hypothetical protein